MFSAIQSNQNLLNASMAIQEQQEKSPRSLKERQGKLKEPSFDDLLLAIGKTRNREAFLKIFEYFAPRTKSFLIKGGISPEIADELSQETMLIVWQKAEQYDPQQAAASTWIFSIARNKRIDYLRKTNKAPMQIESDPVIIDDTVPVDEILNRDQQNRELAAAIKKLPPEQATLIEQSYFQEKPHTVIAQETSIPLGTVKSRIRLGLEKLRNIMENDNKQKQ